MTRAPTACLLLFALSACHKKPDMAAAVTLFAVEVAPAVMRDVQSHLRVPGSLSPFETVQVTAQVTGNLERLNFLPGARVRRGDVLAQVEIERFDLTVAAAQAELQRAQASLQEANQALERRLGANQDHPGLVRADEIGKTRAQLHAEEAQVQSAEIALKRAQLDQRDAKIRAPIDGVMETRAVERGQYVQPGTLLGTLVQRTPMVLRFQLAPESAHWVSTGNTVSFTTPPLTAVYQAKITHVASHALEPSHLIPVEAHVTDANAPLRAGLFAQVDIEISSPVATLVIPEAAVSITENGPLAFVVQDGKVQSHVLTLGRRGNDASIQVLHGLNAADSIVVRGIEGLFDGAAVRIVADPVAQTP